MSEPNPSKIKSLGLVSLVCLVVANTIGAGVYTSSGFALADLQTRTNVLVAWALAGAIAMLGAICYGGLAKQLTQSGGEYLFLSRAMHPLAGFMAGWVSLTAGFSGAIAYAAMVFQAYLPTETSLAKLDPVIVPLMLIGVFGALHLAGLSTGTRVQNVLVVIKLVVLGGFILFGASTMILGGAVAGDAVASEPASSDAFQPVQQATWAAFATSLMWLSFSYAGYNAAVYVAGTSRGGTTVARSMWIATLVVTLLYLALNAVVLYSVETRFLAGQKEVLKIAAFALGGAALERIVTGVILLSLATSVSAMIQAGPHIYAQMARDGLLPRVLAAPEHQVPKLAVVLQMVLAGVVVVFAELKELLDYLAFLLSISSAATVACLLLPKFAGRPAARPVPLWPWTPLAFVLISLGIAAVALDNRLEYRLDRDLGGMGRALVVMAIGLVLYPLFRWWGARDCG